MPDPIEILIPLAQINPPPHQLRETIDAESLGALADDIGGHGLLQAIGVSGPDTGGRYTIGFGHRRFLAHQLLQRPDVRARVWPPGTDLLDIAVAENHFRKDLNPIEDARAMRQFVERGEPIISIARRYRCSDGTVRQRLALLELPTDVQAAIERDEISVAVGQILGSIDHDDYRRSLIDEATRGGTSARIANVWAAHYVAERERIIHNRLAVQEIIAQRADFILYAPCDGCQEAVPYDQTRGLRFCPGCFNAIMTSLQGEQRETSQPTKP